jgi:hypothetical protein
MDQEIACNFMAHENAKNPSIYKISSSLGPLNLININSDSLKQKISYAKGLETHVHEKDNVKV